MLHLTSGIFPIDNSEHMPVFITFPIIFLREVKILSSILETAAKNVRIDSKDPTAIILMPSN